MKMVFDLDHKDREFNVGDWVYLPLQSYRQTNIKLRTNFKLSPRFYGPFKILQRNGPVAYKLELPTRSRIHPVFHVSVLKKKLGSDTTTAQS